MNNFRIFDAHLHIIDVRFPLVANDGYVPEAFSCDDYLQRMRACSLAGGAVVSGSFQGFDQAYLLHALEQLGPSFVGVTQLPKEVADEEILALDAAGVRAVRFNLKRGGSEKVEALDRLARRVYELARWHVELYVDASELAELYPVLRALPAVSVDHLGLTQAGMPELLKLVEQGVRAKASGFGRVNFDVASALRALNSANPNSLMFGSDLPSTRAPRGYRHEDKDLIINALGEQGAQKVFCENALSFYRLPR